MPTTTRRAALNALTDADSFAICLALGTEIVFLEKAVELGHDLDFWQLKLDAAKVVRDRIYAIRAAS